MMVFEPPCTERYARGCERSTAQIMSSLLLDYAPSMGALEEETLSSLLSNGMYNELDKELEK